MARQRVPGRLSQLLRLAADEMWGVHSPLPISASAPNASPSAAHACDALTRGAARRQPAAHSDSLRHQPASHWHDGPQHTHAAGWRCARAAAPLTQHGQHRAKHRRYLQTSHAAATGKAGSGSTVSSSAAAAGAADGQTERTKQRGRRTNGSEAAAVDAAGNEASAPDVSMSSPRRVQAQPDQHLPLGGIKDYSVTAS